MSHIGTSILQNKYSMENMTKSWEIVITLKKDERARISTPCVQRQLQARKPFEPRSSFCPIQLTLFQSPTV